MLHKWKVLLLSVFFVLLSFFVRASSIELEGVNPDEPIWHGRIKNFVSAVKEGNLFYTQQSLHPAVTLEWLTGIGRELGGHQEKIFPYSSPEAFQEVRQAQILPVTLVISISVGLMFWFLYILTSNFLISFISLLLISLNPFFIAHSRVFQMDGLLAAFMVLSMLSLLIYIRRDSKSANSPTLRVKSAETRRVFPLQMNRWLITSGVFGGLAILTKLPALFLFPYVFLILLLSRINFRNYKLEIRNWREVFINTLKYMIIWSIIATMVFILLYPAIWVEPVLSIKNLIWGLVGRGLTDTHPGTDFFLGNIVDGPDWRFYPLVLALRTTPITFIFGLVGVISGVGGFIKKKRLSPAFAFCLFTFAFLIQMTIVAKKSDRYLLPAILSFDLLAGYGIALVTRWAQEKYNFKFKISNIIVLLLFTFYFLLLVPLRGHFLSYYNPLFGGANAASEKMVVGWGEGLYEAAEYLNDPPAGGGVVGYFGEGLRPLIRGDFHNLIAEPNAKVDYLVVYINQVQRQRHWDTIGKYYNKIDPVHIVKLNGVEYVWVYEVK